MRYMRFMLICAMVVGFCCGVLSESRASQDSYTHASYSDNGQRIIFSKNNYTGVYIYDDHTKSVIQLNDYNSSGYFATWNKTGSKVGFKYLKNINGRTLQAPAIYDVDSSELLLLSEMNTSAGVPSFSDAGLIAYTVGHTLYISDSHGHIIHSVNPGHYVNLARISPDGKSLVYNDINDQLHIYDLKTHADVRITHGDVGYYAPIWSPDGKKIVAKTLSSHVVAFDVINKKMYDLGPGDAPQWLNDSEQILFAREKRNSRYELISSRICVIKFDGRDEYTISGDAALHRYPGFSRDSKRLIYYHEGENRLKYTRLVESSNSYKIIEEQPVSFKKYEELEVQSVHTSQDQSDYFDVESTIDAPYLHQVYDTPNWFYAGYSACGATSAMMGIMYYHILPPWPCTCSYPYQHTSNYGRYVSDIYIYNGYTYNIRGYNSSGHSGYGAFGFIVQNNWANTKEYMAMYLRQHGMGSKVDWYPSLAKIDTEIEQARPFVILTSITSAGHYKLVVGHDVGSHSIVVNDPYGNKNHGTYPNYNGKRAIYDWPGYNNGHENMNIVWCYIYMRYNIPDLTLSEFSLPDTLTVGDTFDVNTVVYNTGSESSAATTIAYYLSTNATFDENDLILSTVHVDSLTKADSTLISTTLTIPDSIVSKKYGLGIKVDDSNLIEELSEGNNLNYSTFIVKGYPEIYGNKPKAGSEIAASEIEIYAKYRDVIVDVDVNSLQLLIDDIDVTDMCNISAGSVTYTPTLQLESGEHNVRLSVANTDGRRANLTWEFTVEGVTKVDNSNPALSHQYILYQNYPNPFNANTYIRYSLDQDSFVELSIFSIEGKKVRTLVDRSASAGLHTILWDGRDDRGVAVSSGVYVYRLKTIHGITVKRLLYLK